MADGRSALRELQKRVQDAGLECGYHTWLDEDDEEEGNDDDAWLAVNFPAHREKRVVNLDASDALVLQDFNLAALAFCGRYQAFYNRDSGEVEALIANVSFGTLGRPHLQRIPGVETREASKKEAEFEEEAVLTNAPARSILRVEEGDRVLEISELTRLGNALLGRSPGNISLKLKGFGVTRHEDAVEALETFGGAFLFDLDVSYGEPLAFIRQRRPRSNIRAGAATHAPRFPRNAYPTQALALYRYGRSSSNLPLLEFLAYYQALEYFFPVFAHDETSRAMRVLLRNPRFNAEDDDAITQLINLSAPAVRAGISEREQLRAALRACTQVDGLRAVLLRAHPDAAQFTERKQKLKGANSLNLDSDFRDQLADRIYSLRCRIVHTKQDGGSASVDLLLPTSEEIDLLGPEIAVLRYITQQALFARAKAN